MPKLGELAELVSGKIFGNVNIEIDSVSEIQKGKAGTITFLGNPKYRKYISETKASAIIVSDKSFLKGKNGIIVQNPQLAFAKILSIFSDKRDDLAGIHPSAIVHESAELGKEVSIGAFAVIGESVKVGNRSKIGHHVTVGNSSRVGTNSLVYSNVNIYQDCLIGDNVIIHSGTVIGSDGFGFVTENDVHHKIPQTGSVIIGNDVEIGANCAIDRATIDETIIEDGTKIDNLVHIAHNVKIGKGCLFAAGVGIAGSVEIGDYCVFAGHSAVAPHLKLGSLSILAAKTGVTKSLAGGKIYAGMPAREIKEKNRRDAIFAEVNLLKKQFKKLENKLQN